MKISLRSQSMLLVIPLAAAVTILLVIALIPYVVVHRDVERVERDLDATLAILQLTAAFTEQSREYADLVVTGSRDDEEDVRLARAKVLEALDEWQPLADASVPAESGVIARIRVEHAALTAAGARLIALVHEGRHEEATAIVKREIRPRADLVLGMCNDARLHRSRDMSLYVARITGGIKYSGFLKFGGLQQAVEDLDTHVTEVLESAALRNTIEAENAQYWDFYLTRDESQRADVNVLRHEGKTHFRAWQWAVLTFTGRHDFGGPRKAAELGLLNEVRREYQSMEKRGDRVLALIAAGSMAEAKSILVAEMEFEDTKIANLLAPYIDHEAVVARENLAFLRQRAARMRLFLGLAGAALVLIGFAVPWFVARRMIGPIVNLQVAAERIGRGDFDARVAVPPVKELSALAKTFNAMTAELQTSRETLRRNEERFALVARATSEVIWDLDMRTRTAIVSGRAAGEYGFEVGTPIAMNEWLERVHPDDREHALREFEASLANGDSLHGKEYRYLDTEGRYSWVVDRAYIVRDADGVPVRVIGAMSDVNARKTAEQTLAALSRQNEMILGSVGEGILSVDRDGIITMANPAAAAMLGRASGELLGTSLRDLIRAGANSTADPRSEDSPVPATLQRGTRETSDAYLFVRADGSMFPTDFTSNPMYDEEGRIIGAVLAFRDITQKFEVDRMKAQFVSTVSHELRTPLTSIRGSLGLLSGGLLGDVSPKGQRMLEIAVSNTDRLIRLINDILDIERLNSGALTLTMRPVDVTDLLQQATEVMKALADKAGVNIVWSPYRGMISADHDRLMQTLTNLLSNAIKFSPPSTTITVTAERVESMVRFRVTDQGRGIPADKLDSVFERFQQVDASDSRDKGGTGLGLAICRTIVQQHGGTMGVESVLNEGSTFYFTVPVADEIETTSPKQTILVCDDDPATRQLLEEMLRGRRYDVITADDRDAVVSLAREHMPAAILLALPPPPTCAWETITALKNDAATNRIPILVAGIAPEGRTEQVAGWIADPLDTDSLCETLERVAPGSASAPRILLVEDDLDLARVLKIAFERAGVTVLHAANGVDAIDIALEHVPDLLVLDVVLPRLNGFSVVKRMKQYDELRNIPLVVYSGSEIAPADRPRLELGPTAFFTKSRIAPEMFEQTVLGLLNDMLEEKTENDLVETRIASR